MKYSTNTIKELGIGLWLRWHLATKHQKARIVLAHRDIAPDEFVTIKCKKCHRKYCLNPTTVLFSPRCECGNDNSGDCRNWLKGDFGGFEVVQIYTMQFPTYDDILAKFRQ